MKLHKVDGEKFEVREVEGEPWPGKDSEGEQCFDNTHFADAAEAWAKLEREADAFVIITGRRVARMQAELADMQRTAGEAAAALAKVRDRRRQLGFSERMECWCASCDVVKNKGLRSRMSVCPQCGDKRCPRAEHHGSECTKGTRP